MSDGEFNVSMNIEASPSIAEIERLRDVIVGATADIKAMTSIVHRHISDSTSSMTKMIETGNKVQIEQFKKLELLKKNRNSNLSGAARGVGNAATGWGNASVDVAMVEASIKAEIAKINTSFSQSVLRVAEANMKAVMRGIRIGEADAVAAATSKLQRQVANTIRRESDKRLVASQQREMLYGESQLKANTTGASIMGRAAAADQARRRRNAYFSNTALVSANDSFRAMSQNRTQMQAANPAYMDAKWAKGQETDRRTVATHGNDFLTGLRDQQFNRNQNTFIRRESDLSFLRADNLEKEFKIESKKGRWLDPARVLLERRIADTALSIRQINGEESALASRVSMSQKGVYERGVRSRSENLDASRYFFDRGVDRNQSYFLNKPLQRADDDILRIRQEDTVNRGTSESLNALRNQKAATLAANNAMFGKNDVAETFSKAKIAAISDRFEKLTSPLFIQATQTAKVWKEKTFLEDNLDPSRIETRQWKRNAAVGMDELNYSPKTLGAKYSKAFRDVSELIRKEGDELLLASKKIETTFGEARLKSNTTPDRIETRTRLDALNRGRQDAYAGNYALQTAEDRLREEANRKIIGKATDESLTVARNKQLKRDAVEQAQYSNLDETLISTRVEMDRIAQRKREEADSDLQRATLLKRQQTAQDTKDKYLTEEGMFFTAQTKSLSEAKKRISLAPEQVAAQISATQRAADTRSRQDATPGYRAAQEVIARRGEAQTIRRAEIGQGRASMEGTLDRLSSNGGADIMAIQTRILVGYQALSMAFNTMKGMARFVVELDKQFKQFQAITATTNYEMTGLEKKLIAVSEATKFTALEVAEAATIMGQAGLSAREVGDSIESVTLLATAAGTDLKSAVDLVTSTLSVFNLQASQTGDIANTMTAAINGSKLTIDKLALGFQYAGNIAAQMGVTYQELTGTLGALANSGIRSGSTLGTGLRQLLVDLQDPSEKFTKTLGRMGLTQQDIDVKTRGLVAVLKTLKTAGFGVGEAFESFEVRAASSYTALANNLDVAVSLQKQFVLSSAAVEANATQMKSFTNTLEKFKSVVGTIAYNTFKPLVEALQQVTDFAAEALSVLNKFPGLLEAVGVAMAALLAAGSFSLFGAVVKGIASGLPILSTFTGLMGGAAPLMERFNIPAGKTVGILQAVMLAFRAHPIVLFFTALSTGLLIFNTFIKKASDTKDRIDTLKGVVAQLTGDIQTARDEVGAIDEVIENLITRRQELNKDPILREAKILEVIQQFKELGLTIDASTSSVDDLISALNKIQDVDLGSQISNLGLSLANNNLLLQEMNKLKGEQQSQYDDPKGGVINSIYRNKGRRYVTDLQSGPMQSAMGTLMTGRADLPNIMDLFKIAFGFSTMPINGTEFNGKLAGLKESTLTTDYDIRNLESKKAISGLTPAEEQRLALLVEQNNAMKALVAAIEPMVANILEINALQETNRNDAREREYLEAVKVARGMGANDLVKDTIGNEQDAANLAERRIQSKNTTATQAEQIAETLSAGFEAAMLNLENNSKAVYNYLIGRNFSAEAAQRAVDSIFKTEALAAQKNENLLSSEKTSAAAKETRDKVNAEKIRSVDKRLKNQSVTLSNTVALSAVKDNEKIIKGILAERKAIRDAIFADEIKAANGDSKVLEEIRGRAKEADEQHALLLEQYAADVADQRVKINEEIFKQTDKALAEDIIDLKEKLRTLGEKIATSRPGAALDALIVQYNLFLDALQGLQSSQQANGMQMNMQSSGITMGKNLSEKSAQAMQFFMGKGLSQAQSQGLVGNLLAESRLNPSAIGDGGKAFGIAQWHPDRQVGLDTLAKGTGKSRDDFGTQLQHVWNELVSTEIASLTRLRRANTVDEATQAAIGYERPKGYTVANPTAGHNYEGRYRYALALGENFGSDQKESREFREDLPKNIEKAEVASLKAVTNASTKDNNRQLAGLSAAAKGAANPESVTAIAKQINAIFDEMISEQVKLYKAENREALASNSPDALEELGSLVSGIEADRATKLQANLAQYDRAAKARINKPVEDAKKLMEEAQLPSNAGKFTAKDISDMQADIDRKGQAAETELLAVAEQELMFIREQLTEATRRSGENSEDAISWKDAETEAVQRLTEAEAALSAQKAIQSSDGPSQQDAFDSAAASFKKASGFFGEDGQLLSQAKQMESVWETTLNGLSGGFETLFMNIANGSMTAGEAMKAFAVQTIQMFMQMIAKALAYQMALKLIKTVGGMGGGIGSVFSSLFTIPGMAAGGIVRAAAGEIVTGGIPNRDSVLRLVEPGEAILRKSAVSAIGQDNLLSINAMGNRTMSTTAPEAMASANGAGTVNVYVVSPDAVPSLGEDDIIATITSNIERKGAVRTLIKQVQMGAA